ncbi:chemotaxis protein CheB [Sphingobacterium wenxiniae]|uniref:protein-glutamate methylesterase n=1 Tax=Sphingobacterium wenxiniae TaxID=683125 RepID=A0A1I6VI52_9SPHI|nr:chemotaxis protein CheB [Sphingobacterium wenxiniae]SFT13330.1 CheB methylesterase [Sphingobacterium wenxiniae]
MTAVAKNIILIGGSAGSYPIIIQIIEALPVYFRAAIIVLIHRNARYETHMEETLTKKSGRVISQANDKEPILQNSIYFATPGYHLLVEPGYTFALDSSEPVAFSRPSIDVLFESAADVYQKDCTAFLLSGANKDGANGISHIDQMGGQTFIQSPDEALITTMPLSAIEQSETSTIYSNQEIISYFRNLT